MKKSRKYNRKTNEQEEGKDKSSREQMMEKKLLDTIHLRKDVNL